MIDTLNIKNFQKHKELEIEFSPTVTTILGSSDSGKSAILRSIRWCLTNRPAGTSFITDGETDATVCLSIDNHIIKRERKGTSNNYFLDDDIYKSFGSSTPAQISSIANIKDINFQLQHEPPWWFSNSAGEVSKQLNTIVDLKIIDRSLARAAAHYQKAVHSSQTAENRLCNAIEQENDMSWATECSAVWKDVVTLRKTWKKHTEESLLTADLLQRVWNAAEDVNSATDKAADTLEMELALQELCTIQDQRKKIENILDTLEDLPELKRSLSRAESELTAINVCPLCDQPLKESNHENTTCLITQ